MSAWWLWHRLRGHHVYRWRPAGGRRCVACDTCDKDWQP